MESEDKLILTETGEEVKLGAVYADFRGDRWIVQGCKAPTRLGSSGRVYCRPEGSKDTPENDCAFFPSVLGMEFSVKSTEIVRGIEVYKSDVYATPGYVDAIAEFFQAMDKPAETRDPDDIEDIEKDFEMLQRGFPAIKAQGLTKEDLYGKLKDAGLTI